MILFDAPYVTIHWHHGPDCIHVEWKGFVHGTMVSDTLNRALMFFQDRRAYKWLADTGKIKALTDEDQKWINDVWFPRAFEAGVRKMALVIPESALGQMSIRRLMSKVRGGEFETAYFATAEEAKRWLHSQ